MSLVNYNWFKLFYDSNLSVDSIENESVIFPNPVDKELRINNKMGAVLELYSPLGKRENITSNEYYLDMSRFNNGIYFIKLKNTTSLITKKIIKKQLFFLLGN